MCIRDSASGVGLHDELPDMKGIFRYEKGDYEDLRRALDEALGDYRDAARALLRESTRPHTVDNWCEATKTAFEEFLSHTP